MAQTTCVVWLHRLVAEGQGSAAVAVVGALELAAVITPTLWWAASAMRSPPGARPAACVKAAATTWWAGCPAIPARTRLRERRPGRGHAVHNGITEISGSHACIHGEKVAFGLLTQLVLEGRPTTEVEEILRFSHRVGLPISLAQVGVDAGSDEQLRRIAERSLIPGESSHNEPFEISPEARVSALRAADRMGRCLL